ncbi:hypothetical protein [Marilutibacter spongiae]|uniref:Uncharacterized protein n=1 Tax=Marilutibacter spongiae TaxID=2025720 RepID=A0A7W3TP97_9GAMM|nr:hypothetical protein [Lysobacter spongiae]MBB1061987.1 hypothetical protein [Lysobacter spongiae]
MAVAMLGMAACSQDANGGGAGAGDEATASIPDSPPIYLDRTVEVLDAQGRNPLQAGYRMRLDDCRKAGVATQPLGEDEVTKLGTERWRYWKSGGRIALRVEHWEEGNPDEGMGAAPASMCAFALKLSGSHDYHDASRSVSVDLETGERYEDPPVESLFAGEVSGDTGDASTKWAGWPRPAESTVAGQPCRQWTSPDGDRLCLWSGGGKWGFSDDNPGVFDEETGRSLSQLVLSAQQAPGQRSLRLVTNAFTVGESFDEKEMLP